MSEPFSKRHEEKARALEAQLLDILTEREIKLVASTLAAAEQELVARMMEPSDHVLLEGHRPSSKLGIFLSAESALARWRAMLKAFCAENGIPIPETESIDA